MITVDRDRFYVIGGTIPRDAPCYIERKADGQLLETLRRGELAFVLDTRQVGKSSLMVRTATSLRHEGVACAVLDLTSLGMSLTSEQWYDGLLNLIGGQFDLEAELESFLLAHERIGPLQRWTRAILEVVLREMPGNVVIFIDEVDVVRSLTFSADEFFAAIRAFYNRRIEEPELRRLTFCIVGSASPGDLIRDIRSTPFNVGRRIEITDFDVAQAAPLAEGFGGGRKGARLLRRVLYWTGGHPYLTQRLCAAAVERGAQSAAQIDQLCTDLFFDQSAGETETNLAFAGGRLLRSGGDVASLLTQYLKVRSSRAGVRYEPTDANQDVLRLSGLVRVVDGRLVVRNRIYRRFFGQRWVRTHMPGAEVRRQQAAFRRGMLRALAVGMVVLTVMAGLVVMALTQRKVAVANAQRAEARTVELRNLLYAANMRVIQGAWDENNVARLADVLYSIPSGQQNTFEWRFWNRMIHTETQALHGHKAPVEVAACSPDGRRIASVDQSGEVILWDRAASRPLLRFPIKGSGAYDLAFFPDGRRIAVAEFDAARVYDTQNGSLDRTLGDRGVHVRWLSISRDGRRLAASEASEEASGHLYDVLNRKELSGLPTESTNEAISPDGRRVAGVSVSGLLVVRDLSTDKVVSASYVEKGGIWCMAWSPDTRAIAVGLKSGEVGVWNADDGRMTWRRGGHRGGIRSIAFSADARRVLSGGTDGTARVWDAGNGKVLLMIRGTRGAAVFTPDGTSVVCGSALGNSVNVWEAGRDRTTTASRTIAVPGDICNLYFSPDGKRLLTTDEYSDARLWDAHTGRPLGSLVGGSAAAAFSPDGTRIVSAGERTGRTSKIFSSEGGEALSSFGSAARNGIAWSPDGRWIVACGDGDGTHVKARVWDARTGRERGELFAPSESKPSAYRFYERWWPVFFRGGHRLAVLLVGQPQSQRTSDTEIWDTDRWRVVLTIKNTGLSYILGVSPDGRRIATGEGGEGGNNARVYDADTGRRLLVLRGHSALVSCVSFSPDGSRIATASFDGTAKLWDAKSGHELLTFKGEPNEIQCVAFSPDGTRIATCGSGGYLRIWFADPVTPYVATGNF